MDRRVRTIIMIRIQEFIRQSSPKDDTIVLRHSAQDGNKPMKTKEYIKSTGMPPSFRIITSPPFSLPGVCISQKNEEDGTTTLPFCPRIQDAKDTQPITKRSRSTSSKTTKRKKSAQTNKKVTSSSSKSNHGRGRSSRRTRTRSKRKQTKK